MKKTTHNNSPWLEPAWSSRAAYRHDGRRFADAAIIGGGIAGISTAYFLLEQTPLSVILLESGRIARGASGHNGGFLASYFERSLASLAAEFGLAAAAEAQRGLESSWELLQGMRRRAKIKTKIWEFTGYAGCASLQETISFLRDSALRRKAGLSWPVMLVAENFPGIKDLPAAYAPFWKTAAASKISSLLQTSDRRYIAALPERKGCMNSATFCEELAAWLLKTYPGRFSLAEHTPARRLVLDQGSVKIDLGRRQTLAATTAILCTNGFERIGLVNRAGPAVEESFHRMVRGIVGYMGAFVEKTSRPATAISFLPKYENRRDIYSEPPYFYMTRRPFAGGRLISIGGPEALMDDTSKYRPQHPYPAEAKRQIENFVRTGYRFSRQKFKLKYLWHGLMGFTPNGVRVVGPEPRNKSLLYNLGCNGVGLLPSIFSGSLIAAYLSGRKPAGSIFEPRPPAGGS